MRTALKLAASCLLIAGIAQPVFAQESPTLKKIKDSGTISLGHRESSIPFSYYDDKQQVVGYSQELMLKVVDAVKTELKMPALAVKLTPVTSQNRIPLVQNGTVDIECGSTTHNTERARQAAFSNTIFIIGTRLLTKKESAIKDFPDLAGKNVVTTRHHLRAPHPQDERGQEARHEHHQRQGPRRVLPDPRNRPCRRLHDG